MTASPVVADVNGDGAPEVVVASDRLHVFDRWGRPLRGWPRRLGGPLASTPHVATGGGVIHVGSDDHRLHAVRLDGRPVDGFPVTTHGDENTSPWVGRLDPDVDETIVFGSDDGGVHAVGAAGTPRSTRSGGTARH